MVELEDVMGETTQVISALIRKPKMSEKLLKRPPFRFLFDVVMALNKVSGFVEHLFSPEQMDSSNISDRESKTAFLNTLISFAGICNGSRIPVRSSRIVAGAEPENTNLLLIALGRACSDDSIDFEAAAAMAKEGTEPGNVPRKGGEKHTEAKEPEQKADAGRDIEADSGAAAEARAEARAEAEAEAAAEAEAKRAKEKERARQKAAEKEKRRQAKAAEKAASEEAASAEPSSESKQSSNEEFDTSKIDGQIETTVSLFAGLISKPKLTEKLLSKPPFRFLHDIISNLNAGSGVVEGLFQGEELDAKQCTTKELKLGYLNKLILFTSTCCGEPPMARASKIVAGHDPEDTNKLLQAIALLVRNDCKGVVSAAKAVATVIGDPEESREQDRAPEAKAEEEPQRAKPRSKSKSAKGGEGQREGKEDEGTASQEEQLEHEKRKSSSEAPVQQPLRDEDDDAENRDLGQLRPQTARKRPPKIREKAAEAVPQQQARARDATPPVGVMMDGDVESEPESDEEQPEDGPLRERRPGSEQSDSNPAQGDTSLKGKLVRDILDDERKQEEGKEESKDTENETKTSTAVGITMGKIGQGLRKGGKGTSGGSTIDVDKIRTAVQTLCQSTNPLGKCMDYVHEDLSAMGKELDRWGNEYRKSCDALEDEQRATNESLLPLRGKLLDVEERIKDEQAKLSTLKASIAKNDQRINELVRDMVLG